MKREGIILLVLVLRLCFAQPMDTVEKKIVRAWTKFGFNLLSEVLRQEREKNIFLSPLSCAIALVMTYNGAKGETKEAMAKVLGLDDLPLKEVNSGSAKLREGLKRIDPKVELHIAQSLWAKKGIKFRDDFLKRNKVFFDAKISVLDFTHPKTPRTINQWVETNTKGKVKEIIKDIDPLTVMFLINAIYFKGKWQKRFDPAKTEKGLFHLSDGKKKEVFFMSQSGRFPYYKGEGFQGLRLPYGEGRMSMEIFLPDGKLEDFLLQLNAENWEKWISRFQAKEGLVKLPRFKLEYENSLVGILKSLGMGIAFDPKSADFTGMREKRDLFISEVKHKAVCEVTEEGTEAAAVTSVEISLTAIREPEERFTFIVDRPFFFAIRDNSTGAILFTGVVREPK